MHCTVAYVRVVGQAKREEMRTDTLLGRNSSRGGGLASQLPQGPFIDIHLLGEIATHFDLRVMRKAA